ncbi:MAG: ATP-binding cassette domain-containing protein, partial [Gemmobacter sp.]
MTAAPVLSLRGLTRDFHRFRAVDDVTLDIRAGSITGLIGPNGAGKTTLFNMVAGELRPTAGQVLLNGADVTGLPPEALFARGLARTFQIPRPFRRMSVLENVLLAPAGQTGETVLGALFRRRATAA